MKFSVAGGSVQGFGAILISALAILTSLVAAAAVNATPLDSGHVAIVFPPWWTATRSVTAAASACDILNMGGVPFVVIAHCDPATAARDARSAGALFILGADPRSLCTSVPLDPKS